MLKDRTVLTYMLASVGRNLHVEKNGKRYKASMKMFYEVLLLWGGPRLANFVALNLAGPEIHSIFQWRKNNSTKMSVGISSANFLQISRTYEEILAKKDIPKVPVLIAEDETAIIATVEYMAERDILRGFCGQDVANHMCEDNVEIHVGDGQEGYNNIRAAFQNYKIGTQARAMIINPLHPHLPKIPIVIHPTCNKFNAAFVSQQWQQTAQLYNTHLKDVHGPLLGRSSDGDSRRRKLMLSSALSREGD